MIVYLFRFQSGTIKQDTERPTELDLQSMVDGELTIYQVDFEKKKIFKCCGYADTGAFWEEIEQAEVEGTHGFSWHV